MPQVFVAGGDLDGQLRDAVAPYIAARLDGSSAEGTHRDVQLTLNRSSASRFAYWSSTLRLKANMAIWAKLEEENNKDKICRFLTMFSQPSRFFAKRWRADTLPQRSRIPHKEMVSHFYRLFPHNMSDWQFVVDRLVAENPAEVKAAMTDVQWVHWDLFRPAFAVGTVFSWLEAGLADAAQDALDIQLGATTVFKIVTDNVTRKGVQHSEAQHLQLPLFVQKYNIVAELSTADSLAITPAGLPELEDGASLVGIGIVRQSLTRWMDIDAHALGNNIDRATTPTLVTTFLQADQSTMPVFFVLLELRRQGWMGSVAPPEWHTAESAKHFKNKGYAKRRQYLRCLMTLVMS